IRKSKSLWASPTVIAPKKGSEPGKNAPRFCVDFRKLNSSTKKDAFPIPRIDDLLDMLEQATWFSSFDLYSGYHQIPLDKDAIEKTAFVTKFGHYEYLKMPFGLCNAPATFQRTMNEIFADLIGRGVIVYIDDVNVYSSTFQQYLVMVQEVLTRISQHNLYIKCHLCNNQMEFLGFVIDRDGIRVDAKKVDA